jgi:hypothetical protein
MVCFEKHLKARAIFYYGEEAAYRGNLKVA